MIGILRSLVLLIVGVLAGAAATYFFFAKPGFAEISIVNGTATRLTRVELVESRFGHQYLAEDLAPSATITFPVFARGELGYRILTVTSKGTRIAGNFYAEAGYEVTHTVSADDISYDVSAY